ncbi:MAG: betaine/proline/choline family ABC transporter ATP-binding protein [Clostridium argentinense]|uniref:Quaternary amine transport ATP-binding protein n=1 Tax=Clostridium faecium TaxID=2762223 RepID=A0ABR8YX54_9CLOT|nr:MULTISPECIES: betaine/proline/choline family ABC transporter ATP-binding protein [Clostridium]MBD8048717.1 betaine/proline/choline family ABC transporter ATP-binding protein [Clostridium faecium]MBS5822484.1 betaine/proline/choline family ABC transporter ATP-binding protein [Clostridium argentinense]MDU1350110.1 betaine/proline/choline family ABC transporter ATP-binding protein [Clostridium argentinense]
MIEFKNIKKSYKDTSVLKNINLKINKGDFVVFIGSSGCGKTTLLKMINKLIKPTSGEIYIDGKNIENENPIELRRKIGYVIQQTGLFPHMTVRENIEIIPRLQKADENKIENKTKELMEMVGLDPDKFIDRYPCELSGGQQQRVGVARAFAVDSEIILMDEPFSALDPITRSDLQEELFNLHQEVKKTIVFVTHDMDEALKLGDKICIMSGGEILQYDTPENILRNPIGTYVEEFIGKNKIWNNPEYIKAKDIMIEDPVRINSKRTILQGIEIMRSKKVDSLLITDKKGTLNGLVTLKSIKKNPNMVLKLEDVMENNVITVHYDDNLIDILETMNKYEVGYVPVVDDVNRLVGLVTRSSLISVLSEQFIDLEVNV